MNRHVSILLCIAALLSIACEADAQRNSRSSAPSFTDKLWYGGSFDIGLSGSQFDLGLAPMAGYKLVGELSAGVRIPFEYTYIKLTGFGGTSAKFSGLDFGAGIFMRQKIANVVFLHTELNHLWVTEPVTQNGFAVLDPENPGKLLTEKTTEDQLNVGLGYTSGRGEWKYELSILYNVLEDDQSEDIPWIVRAGFNYRF
ncbi:MAG: hypothetical protein R3301_08875 [Saprospiraceae bacterium]|nr:hypothetical protein [Saprospiraceae bacterium]